MTQRPGILNNLEAGFSHAYVRAIAHAAGYFAEEAGRERDNDGVDLELFSRDAHGVVRSPTVCLQVKATQTNPQKDPIPFDLDVKNYDELRATSWQVPRILVVVFVPKDPDQWAQCSRSQLVLRRCGYWQSLRGEPRTSNSSTIRVTIPRTNLLDVAAVQAIMDRVRQGKLP